MEATYGKRHKVFVTLIVLSLTTTVVFVNPQNIHEQKRTPAKEAEAVYRAPKRLLHERPNKVSTNHDIGIYGLVVSI